MQALSLPGLNRPFDARTQSRTLIGCVLASLALHAALLFLLPGMREGTRASAPVQILSAVLSPRGAPLPPLPAPVAEPLRPEPRPLAKPEAPRPVLTAPAPSPSAPVIAPPPSIAAPVAPPVSSPPPAQPAVAAPRPEPQTPAAPAIGPARDATDSADAGSLQKYKFDLFQASKKYDTIKWDYGQAGLKTGSEYRVTVKVMIGVNGNIVRVVTEKSSGSARLDRHAVEAVTKAKPWVQIPPALRNKEFDVPIDFVFKMT